MNILKRSLTDGKTQPKKPRGTAPVVMTKPPTLKHGEYTREALCAAINTHGFCVITGVLDEQTTTGYLARVYAAYASLYDAAKPEQPSLGLDPAQPATLVGDAVPPYKGNGIINVESVAALQVCEDVRAHPNVAQVFELWFDDKHLLTSFDRIGMNAPGTTRGGLAPHVDANVQQPDEVDRQSVLQGSVVLRRGPYADQGFVVWRGHHNDIGKWQRDPNAPNKDWYPIGAQFADELGRGEIVTAPAGSMIVWLSSAVHGNTSGAGKRSDVGRVVVFVSKQPMSEVSDEAYQTVVNARLTRTTLGHSVINPRKLPPGGGQYQRGIAHRFAEEHLTKYKTPTDIPTSLVPRKNVQE